MSKLMELADALTHSHGGVSCKASAALKLAADNIEEQAKEIAELRVYAERYRWLRDNSAYVAVNPHARTCLWTLRDVFEIPGQGFDAAIDAARSKT